MYLPKYFRTKEFIYPFFLAYPRVEKLGDIVMRVCGENIVMQTWSKDEIAEMLKVGGDRVTNLYNFHNSAGGPMFFGHVRRALENASVDREGALAKAQKIMMLSATTMDYLALLLA